MKKSFLAFLVFGFVFSAGLFAQVDIPIPKGQVQIIDDFENGNYWIWAGSDWDQWGGHKVSSGADLYKKWVSEGKYSMQLVMDSVEPGNDGSWFYDGGQDLSGGKYIVCDFYNPTPINHNVAIVLQCTDNWNWNQSDFFMLPPGEHTIVFKVEHLNEHFDEVKRINISDYVNEKHEGDTSIFVDNIRLIK
ncbi:MAG: hypothetical protein K5866_06295 [Treponema sp.]|nr:hypothetical protein [Treponema sp.]